jgi:hypothetical protein
VSHATTRKSPMYGIVNRVVDSLDLRIYRDYTMSSFLEGALETIRTALAEAKLGQSEFIDLPGLGTWEIKHPGKLRAYEFSLKNRQIADIYIWKPEQWRTKQVSDTGQIYISFRSSYLQQGSIPRALDFVDQLCRLLFSPVRLLNPDSADFNRISRVDLAVDYEDRRVLTMTDAEKKKHSTIIWEDLDCYQTRGKRTKREAFYSSMHGDAKELLLNFLRRSRKNVTEIQGALKALGLAPSPPYDNRGGHCDTNQQNGFEGSLNLTEIKAEQNLVLNGDDAVAIALENMVILLADHLLETTDSDGKAEVTRVVGSRKPQTVYIGRFGGDIYAVEYFKQSTLIMQNKTYMVSTWLENGWNPACPVWRTEFRMSGDFLRQFIDTSTGERVDLRDPEVFLDWIPRVWTYNTRTWARHTIAPLGNTPHGKEISQMVRSWIDHAPKFVPQIVKNWLLRKLEPFEKQDDNRSRWDPSERWETIQNGWNSDDLILRLKRPPNPNIDGLKAGILGYSKSIAAKLSAVPEIKAKALETCGFASAPKSGEKLKQYQAALIEAAKSEVLNIISTEMFNEDTYATFDAEIEERRASFGLDDSSDAAISTLLRSERMREGDGS